MIGTKIKELRLAKNLTQETLAAKLYISPQAVSKWEQGISVPDTLLLVPLSDALGVTVDYLLREASNSSEIDIHSLIEIKTGKLENRRAVCSVKNTSQITIRRLYVEEKYLDVSGAIIDYSFTQIWDLAPGYAKQIILNTICCPDAASVELKVTDFSLG